MPEDQQTKRAVAYIRESTEEQGRGYSPDGQRQAIAGYAADHGMQLVEEYLDFETGRLAEKRSGFQRLIEDAMERRFEVVLVFHTSRFARNTVEAKRYKKLLRSELGIEVISVTQPLGANADDPAAFLSESVHEIFDEYYSVSLSFWTKMGLREKARQGLLTGSPAVGLRQGRRWHCPARPRARAVRAQDLRYVRQRIAHRPHARRVAERQRAAYRARPRFRRRHRPRDALQHRLCRIRLRPARQDQGHQGPARADVEETLFDRVQELRRQRARTLKPGRPSQRYLLRGLARRERCQAKMQGTAIGRKLVPRYYCATRRADHTCDQPLIHADLVETQLVEFIAGFKPAPHSRPSSSTRPWKPPEKWCVKSGSDGGRVRGLPPDVAEIEVWAEPPAAYVGLRDRKANWA